VRPPLLIPGIKSSGVNMSEQYELEITWEQQWWTHCNKIIEIILIKNMNWK
jgi:hypothetical protein